MPKPTRLILEAHHFMVEFLCLSAQIAPLHTPRSATHPNPVASLRSSTNKTYSEPPSPLKPRHFALMPNAP